ncbi:hypothetical protein BJF79_23190 [Actinomadura sp. CNU-125]|uniref:hypothetical protein n=1 Tax=Actinomadura sp. CNU-125 TaxID=1904961 RepID=UPI0009688CDE|nr:hypothetical protein [Actinomadura sp. CNU-125]OLT11930.1 hypothetical protein BJF79_23190 [Actinomadura sp. CNU-125]
MKNSKFKALAAATAASLGLALLAPGLPAASAAPAAAEAAPVPEFDLANNCPALPPEGDPATWDCMVMAVAGGSMQLGGLTQEITSPIKIVVQTGPPEGGGVDEIKQIKMLSEPMKIPGGVLGLVGLPSIPGLEDVPGFKVEVASEYAGNFSFALPNAKVSMRVRIINLLLGNECYLGGEDDPIDFNMVADGSTIRLVSPGDPADPLGSPLIIGATASDDTFTVPESDCGIWSPLIDWQAGLPSPAGENSATFETYIAIGNYSQTGGAAATARTTRAMTDPRTFKVG